jgi:hypothetical protein
MTWGLSPLALGDDGRCTGSLTAPSNLKPHTLGSWNALDHNHDGKALSTHHYMTKKSVEYDGIDSLICHLAINGNHQAIVDELVQLHRDKMYAFFKIHINEFKDEDKYYALHLIQNIFASDLNRGYLISILILLSEHMMKSIENLKNLGGRMKHETGQRPQQDHNAEINEEDEQILAIQLSNLFDHDDIMQIQSGSLQSIRIQQQTIHAGSGVEMEVVPYTSHVEDMTRLFMIEFLNLFLNFGVIKQRQNEKHARSILECIRIGTPIELPNQSTCKFWNKVMLLTKPRELEQRAKLVDDEIVKEVKDVGDVLSDGVFSGATMIKTGLKEYLVPFVNTGIEKIGETIITNSEARVKQPKTEEELKRFEESIALSRDAVEFSGSVKETVRSVTSGIREFSVSKINDAKKVWTENEVGKQIIPDDDMRQVAASMGKVGIATLGAAGLLLEAVIESARDIGETTVKVASDVTTHKHGEEAGQVVNNVGVTTGNVLRTVTHVASARFEAVARNSAKVSMEEKNGTKSIIEEPILKSRETQNHQHTTIVTESIPIEDLSPKSDLRNTKDDIVLPNAIMASLE